MTQSRTRISSVTVRSRTPLAQVQQPGRKEKKPPEPSAGPQEKAGRAPSFGDRMLRNTAVAVAILLCAVAARTAGLVPEGGMLAQTVTMDLDESLGNLQFVSNLLPESARVFWNLGDERHDAPSEAAVVHAFSEAEPYIAFSEGTARASCSGEVMSVVKDALGRQTVRLRHESGLETIYGNLLAASVREGDWVETGETLGVARALTYEMRAEGLPMDPGPYLK